MTILYSCYIMGCADSTLHPDGNKVEPSKPNNNIYSYHSPPSTRKNKQGTLRTNTEHNSNQNDDKDNKENIRTVNGQLGVPNNKHLKGDVGRLSDARMEREKKLKSRQKRLTAVAEDISDRVMDEKERLSLRTTTSRATSRRNSFEKINEGASTSAGGDSAYSTQGSVTHVDQSEQRTPTDNQSASNNTGSNQPDMPEVEFAKRTNVDQSELRTLTDNQSASNNTGSNQPEKRKVEFAKRTEIITDTDPFEIEKKSKSLIKVKSIQR